MKKLVIFADVIDAAGDMAKLDEKALRRRRCAQTIGPWSALVAILFVILAVDAQNNQQQTSPKVKVQETTLLSHTTNTSYLISTKKTYKTQTPNAQNSCCKITKDLIPAQIN
jgi:hypothetical protein